MTKYCRIDLLQEITMAQYATLNIEIIKGATFTRNMTFTDEQDQAIDLTNHVFTATVRKRKQDTDTLGSFTVTTTVPAEGKVLWSMTDEATNSLPYGTHYFEMYQIKSDGTKVRVLEGEAKVK